MKIELRRVKVSEVVAGYTDSNEEGVTGFNGLLDIRPKYQREFVYSGKQREAVMKTVRNNFPLNSMYWMIREDGGYEVLDGQQRTISVAQYVNSDYSIDGLMFHNLTMEEQQQILDYELMIYFCSGTDRERLDWFQTINIAGEKLTAQEIRNAVYTGPWLSDAKLKFSKSNCAAYLLSIEKGALLSGSPIRQEYLETILEWISKENINDYMAINQPKSDANELWDYFKKVVGWVHGVFPNYRSEMKKVPWGHLYNDFSKLELDPLEVEINISTLMQDDEVTNKSGIYSFILNNRERELSLRGFSENTKREVYEKQKGKCVRCSEKFEISGMEADHITPWSLGGRTIASNCQLLCKNCNRVKSNT